ncbi:dicarboxylate/amino acid:cation symporter [Oceanimonas doudoroffii]|uniref:Dicarboxylate/amino acid:cation symporter n=1 Tax=Oceanimonas doudoroffii TaxID=84158 RepID=A0A233RE08_9GAMM|nr:dicarboxylate/amino acid:cation symporter [Oceanimonas doudoroffii]OXY81619.1 dicarboxylate/amino acid:cation symporter [Oceanimonas doudoroffii]
MNTATAQPHARHVGKWKRLQIWQKVLIGLLLGAATGFVLGEHAAVLHPVGKAFIAAIKMLVVPLIFVSLVCGVTAIRDVTRMGRIGIKTFATYIVTTAIAIPIGLILAVWLKPGVGMDLGGAAGMEAKAAPSIVDTLLGIIPSNPFAAFATGNVLQIILFAIFLGIAINLAGEKADPVRKVFDAFADVMYKLTDLVIAFAPYGVFALIATTTGQYGLDVLLPLGKVILGVYLGCLLHALVTLGGGLALLARLNPVPFFKGIFEAQLVAFSTTTAAGTLPVTMACARENLGVSKDVSSFVLPVGTTINLDGTALYQALTAVFIAQAYGIDLGMAEYGMILLTAILASIGTASVPGGGLIVLSLVLTSVGLPLEGIALVAGIDRILDMARTTINVTGDAAVSVLIAHSEGELDRDIYYRKAV